MTRAVEFTLKSFLEAHGLSVYRLAEAASGRVSRGTVYSLARGLATRVDLGTLGAVITTLEELTGEVVTPADLLQAVDVPVNDETRGWLEASIEPPMEPYDWGDVDPTTLGRPIRWMADGQMIIEMSAREISAEEA